MRPPIGALEGGHLDDDETTMALSRFQATGLWALYASVDSLPTSFSGAIGPPSISLGGSSHHGYSQNSYNFAPGAQTFYPSLPQSNPSSNFAPGAQTFYPSPPQSNPSSNFAPGAQTFYPSPPQSNPSSLPPKNHQAKQCIQHAVYDPSYSPSRFVQPSLNSSSYGFPSAPQTTAPACSTSPLARRNSAVDHSHRARPPISDHSSLSGALDASMGPARVRSNSIQKHGLVSPYKTGARPRGHSIIAAHEPMRNPPSKSRRGSRQIGPCLPDGPPDYVRVPQEAYQEPVTQLGYKYIGHYRSQPIPFKYAGSTSGIRLKDIDGEFCRGLEGSCDRVFESFPYREIKIKVLWPGYPPCEKRFKTQDGLRGKLLLVAATAVTHTMQAITRRFVPVKRGFEAWSIGRGGWTLDDIIITGVEHRGGANFQVEVWVPKRKFESS
ncbi:hypothetical protein GGX14DRAFT_629755 [Mycena pura]|uniref:Uncharacterized protein n=1 Tax=Mycena pura TaxID=153505 RepID=A0AAD6YRU6_9AGAR|nr:hypothetical protein GGX14DRAFT_629755 [Mycena pura]